MDSDEMQDAYGPDRHIHVDENGIWCQEGGVVKWEFNKDGSGFIKEPEYFRPFVEDDEQLSRLKTRMSDLEAELAMENLASDIHEINEDKGFWGPPEMMDKYAAKMMLVVTETSEVVEALRKSQGTDKVTEEFSDIFIRALDLYHVLVEAGEADPRLYKVLLEKVETNRNRPPKHGNRWG